LKLAPNLYSIKSLLEILLLILANPDDHALKEDKRNTTILILLSANHRWSY